MLEIPGNPGPDRADQRLGRRRVRADVVDAALGRSTSVHVGPDFLADSRDRLGNGQPLSRTSASPPLRPRLLLSILGWLT